MASINTVMTQVMNNPTIFIAGLAVGYIAAKIQQKIFGRGMGGMGGGL